MSKTTRRRTNQKTKNLALMSILTALIVVMAFTPIGYLKILSIAITFIPIPVAIGAIILGPAYGAVLGAVFGITSLIQCFGLDPFGTNLMSISPVFTVLLCIVPRILMGALSGGIFKILKNKVKNSILAYGISSFSGGFLNTVFFVGFLILLFGNSELFKDYDGNILAIITSLVTINAVIEWIACLFIGTAVAKALTKILNKTNK